ncbi:DUF2752 domain-containing protein [Actinoallomurus acanthiterrae]
MPLATFGLVIGGVMAVFGLPPVDLHGPLHFIGIMDPLCGGTRAVRLAMRGQWARSWSYNPLGVPLVIGAVLVLLRQIAGLVTGHWLNARLRRSRLTTAVIIAVFIAIEINQQFHADLLMSRSGS